MKIDGVGKSAEAGKSKKKDKVSGGGSFGDMLTGAAGQSQGASASQSVARVDALLAVQETESPTERAARKRMTQRADAILSELEKIRMGLLMGTMTVGDVLNVADVVASHREKISDPALTAILDEIDLRAQIELAKIRVAMRQAG